MFLFPLLVQILFVFYFYVTVALWTVDKRPLHVALCMVVYVTAGVIVHAALTSKI